MVNGNDPSPFAGMVGFAECSSRFPGSLVGQPPSMEWMTKNLESLVGRLSVVSEI